VAAVPAATLMIWRSLPEAPIDTTLPRVVPVTEPAPRATEFAVLAVVFAPRATAFAAVAAVVPRPDPLPPIAMALLAVALEFVPRAIANFPEEFAPAPAPDDPPIAIDQPPLAFEFTPTAISSELRDWLPAPTAIDDAVPAVAAVPLPTFITELSNFVLRLVAVAVDNELN